jgi:hypothetical protein
MLLHFRIVSLKCLTIDNKIHTYIWTFYGVTSCFSKDRYFFLPYVKKHKIWYWKGFSLDNSFFFLHKMQKIKFSQNLARTHKMRRYMHQILWHLEYFLLEAYALMCQSEFLIKRILLIIFVEILDDFHELLSFYGERENIFSVAIFVQIWKMIECTILLRQNHNPVTSRALYQCFIFC